MRGVQDSRAAMKGNTVMYETSQQVLQSQAGDVRTEVGKVRATVRATLGRLSMRQKRTSCWLEKRPIWTAWRRMTGRSAIVRNHSESTASMAALQRGEQDLS